MEKLNKIRSSINFLIVTLVFLLISSVLNLLNILGSTGSGILSMLFGLVTIFFLGFIFGKKRDKNGYIAGIIVGLITITIFFLISIIFLQVKVNITMLIYYIILFISCIMGSMVGINKKETKKD